MNKTLRPRLRHYGLTTTTSSSRSRDQDIGLEITTLLGTDDNDERVYAVNAGFIARFHP